MSPSAAAGRQIVGCEVFVLSIPLKEPFRIALQTISAAENIFVRLTLADGRQGWGEASPLHAVTGETPDTCAAAARVLGRALLGKDPIELRDRATEMAHALPFNPSIRSAFDIALHDLAAQTAGLPLYRFLGGSPRELRTDLTLGIAGVAATAEAARNAVRMRFGHLKIKIGLDPDRDVAAVAAVREAVGPTVRFRLDANQAWDRQQALEILRTLAPHGIQFCEQPVPKHDLDGLSWLAQRSPVPIMADEAVFVPSDLLRIPEVPYANLKVAKSGGIHALLRADAVAATTGISTMLGCMMESRLGLTASAHAALAGSSFRFFDLDTHFDLAEDPIVGGIRYERSAIIVPEEPGLGAAPRAELLGNPAFSLE